MLFDIPNLTAPQKGSILLAEPFTEDNYFHKSVVLLTEHNEEGSLGFVLNKLSDYVLSELVEDVGRDLPVYIGGPVEGNCLHYIHTFYDVKDSIPIDGHLFWGGDFETIKAKLRQEIELEGKIQFFLGYSGWSPHQLDEELNHFYWGVNQEPDGTSLLNKKPDLWYEQVLHLGEKYKTWFTVPDDPQLN